MKAEARGLIGAENVLCDGDVGRADGIVIPAADDKDVDLLRFGGKRVPLGRVAESISVPDGRLGQPSRRPTRPGIPPLPAAGEAGALLPSSRSCG
ncbi:hypothetical protein [Streptomyces albus]|uniref:hypothetical protein n=1 Tax=Streptomyces albus TaxID=1888 RepID=UPI0034525B07